jgi:uncharacterized Ntn-hydrolase superfamily protein
MEWMVRSRFDFGNNKKRGGMRYIRIVSALFVLTLCFIIKSHNSHDESLIATFSIVAVDVTTGDVGVAVQSKFPNVRPVVPWAEAGVGAVATQSFANVSFGPRGLELLRNGASAEQALQILLASDQGFQTRQVGIVDIKGRSASWTGSECFDWAGGMTSDKTGGKNKIITGHDFAAQGNILVSKATVEALAEIFQKTKGSLADRLLTALIAGGKAGGDRRGEQSAALLVKRLGAGYDSTSDDYIDISVYDHPTPIKELERLYNLHKLYFFHTDEKNTIPIETSVCRELQSIMKDKYYKGQEFYSGLTDGKFTPETKKALQDFMGWENYDVRIRQDSLIDKEVLDDIRKNYQNWKLQSKRNKKEQNK